MPSKIISDALFLLLVEKFNGGLLSTALREKTQMVGFSLLISLMVFENWNDLMSLLEIFFYQEDPGFPGFVANLKLVCVPETLRT